MKTTRQRDDYIIEITRVVDTYKKNIKCFSPWTINNIIVNLANQFNKIFDPWDTLDEEKYLKELTVFTIKEIAKELWLNFGTVPIDPETEKTEEEWNGFPVGTFREDIWHWFEETFNVSVAEDLMGL